MTRGSAPALGDLQLFRDGFHSAIKIGVTLRLKQDQRSGPNELKKGSALRLKQPGSRDGSEAGKWRHGLSEVLVIALQEYLFL